MTLTNPNLTLTFLGDDLPAGHSTTQTITYADIHKESVTFTYQLLNGLKPSSNQVALSIKRKNASIADIIATDGDIKAVFKNGTTVLFTGYVSTSFTWTVTETGEELLKITLEDTGTRLLSKCFITTGKHLFNCTVYNALTTVCTAAGITVSSSVTSATLPQAVIKVVDSSATCESILQDMLYEVGYVYYFNSAGELCVFEVNCTSTSDLPVYDKTKLYTSGSKAVSLSKKIRQYKSARITYTATGTATNYLIYRNTSGQDDSHPYCYLEMPAGSYFDGLEVYSASEWAEETASEFREDSLVEACNADSETEIVGSNEIIAVTEVTNVVFNCINVTNISNSITLHGGPYLKILNHNPSTVNTGYIKQQDAYGSIIYEKSQEVIRTSADAIEEETSDNLFEEELSYVHTRELAKRHANLVCQYHKYCNSTYTFYCTEDITLGTLIKLKEDVFSGLEVNVLVYAKKYDDKSNIVQYTAVGISVFSLTADVYTQKEGRGDSDVIGPAGADGNTPLIQYALGTSSSDYPSGGSVQELGVSATNFFGIGTDSIFSIMGWSDIVPSVVPSGYYIWMRVSRDNGSTWQYSRLTGENGEAGQSTYKSSAYYRGSTAPSTPTGGSYSSPVPTTSGWTAYVPLGTDTLWVSTRIFTSDGLSPQESAWSTPQQFSDTTAFVRYRLNVSPANIIKDLGDTQSQIITLGADIAGYDDDHINYSLQGSFLGDRYRVTSDTSASATKQYYTFAITADTIVQSGKTYYLNRTSYFEECVNLTTFTSGLTYYERSTASFATGVYELSLDCHAVSVPLPIPYINSYSGNIKVGLYYGTTVKEETELTVIDQTEYEKCVGILNASSTGFPTSYNGKLCVENNVVVFSEECTFDGVTHAIGSVWYLNASGTWVETVVNEKTAGKMLALQALIEQGVSLTALNEKSVIKWFSEIVATSITASYIGAKQIQIVGNGSIRGGDYDANGNIPSSVTSPVGFHISSAGKLQAADAYLERVTVTKDSTLKGKLMCGNDDDVMIETQFENGAARSYSISNGSYPDGFSWAEVYAYLKGIIGTPGTAVWNSNANTSNTLCSLISKSVSGTVNGNAVSGLVYAESVVSSCTTISTQVTQQYGETQNRTTTLTNPLPYDLTVNYEFIRGIANWIIVFVTGAEKTGCSYTILKPDGTTTTTTLCTSTTDEGATNTFTGSFTLPAGATVTFTYGYISAPGSNYNNGLRNSQLTLSWSLAFEAGFNFYTSSLASSRFLMPTSGYWDLNSSTLGMVNLTWDSTVRLNLPRSSAAWGYSSIYKYYSFATGHTGDPVSYSVFTSCSALYILDANGRQRGSSSPTLSLVTLVSIASGELAFCYDGVTYSQVGGGWVRGYSIIFVASSTNKGLYTASIYPRLGNELDPQEDIGTSNNKYRNICGKNGIFDSATISSLSTASKTNITKNSASTAVRIGAGIVDVYTNGNSWYRIWSDGWIEQGGITETAGDQSTVTVTLYPNFTTTNYSVVFGQQAGVEGSYTNGATVKTRTLQNFTMVYRTGGSAQFFWYACGY